jgi:hypothetical protein
MDLFRRMGSAWIGSALKIAIMVGGIPALRLRTVLKLSVVIFSKALSSILPGSYL